MSIFLPCYRPAKTNSFLQNGTKYLLIWLFADRARTHLKTVILITSLTLTPLVRMAGSPFSSACYLSATGMISQSKLFPERRAPTTELISPIIVDPRGCERPSQSSRPMREQRHWKATNGRPEASGDAPAELAAHISHHFERFPGCRLLAGELPGGHRRQPSKTEKLLLNASSPALSKDLSGLQKVSQLNFAFCSSFRCPAQQCYLQSRTLWELFGSGR